MSAPTLEALSAALAAVVDPTFGKPLGDLGTLSGVSLTGTVGAAQVRLSSPAEEVKQQVKQAIDRAAAAIGVTLVEVTFSVQVPTRDTTMAAATEISSAGICATSASPTASRM